jgi:Acyltransferase family.
MPEENERLYYVDWIRALVVLTLIPFHAALTFIRYGTVYIKEPLPGLAALPFLIVTVPLGDSFMATLFFVSGIASYFSFKKRGTGEYIGERATRLMIPFGLGFLLLNPFTAYFQALYEGFTGGFINFLPQFYWFGAIHYSGYGHLWFLLYLFVFSALCLPLFVRWRKDESRLLRIGAFLSKGERILIPVAFIFLIECGLRPFFNSGAYIIYGDWANVVLYISMLVFGYVFAASPELREKVKKYFLPSAIAAGLALATLFYVNVNTQMFYSDAIYLTVLWVIAKALYECFGLIFILNIGMRFLNKKSRALSFLNKESFKIYIFHFFPVTFFTWLFIDKDMGAFAKFLLTVALSYIFVFAVCLFWRLAAKLIKRIGKGSGGAESRE